MKSIFTTFLLFFLIINQSQSQSLKNTRDSLSYAFGQDIGRALKKTEVDINIDVLLQSLSNLLLGKESLLSEEDGHQIIQTAMRKAFEQKNEKLKKDNEDFLANNATKPGVVTTAEGIQYQVLVQGNGANPTSDDEVEVHYEGTLIDGKKFDSSYDRQETITLSLDRVIEGWKLGIPLMKVGSKYRFFIPAHLGYGERNSAEIPAYSTLIFDVELISIKQKANETPSS